MSATTTTLKLQLNDEIRRISLNSPIGVRQIQQRAADLFALDVATRDAIRFTYRDDDGDDITVGSDADLAESLALNAGKTLKLNVVVPSKSTSSTAPSSSSSAASSSSSSSSSAQPQQPKNLGEFVDQLPQLVKGDAELAELARNFGVSLEGSLADIIAQASTNPLIAQLIGEFRRGQPVAEDADDNSADSDDDGEQVEAKAESVKPQPAEPAKPVHNAWCDGCHVRIQGIRFKCAVCPDFDFCEKCNVFAGEKHPSSHSFHKIERPVVQHHGWQHRAWGNGPCAPQPHHGHHRGPHHGPQFRGQCPRWAFVQQQRQQQQQQQQQQQAQEQAKAHEQPAEPNAEAKPVAIVVAPPAAPQYELEHVTVQPNSPLAAGQDVVKLFKVKNVSGEEWPQSTALVFASGQRVGDFRIPVGKVPAGEERYIAVDIKVPAEGGRVVAAYRLAHSAGSIQGEPLVIDFQIVN